MMTSRARRGNILLAFLLVAIAFGSAPNRAEAQWGGGGFGFGAWGAFSPVPKPESFINSMALVAASRPSTAPNGHPYAGDGNAYYNHVRDNGFIERYNVDRRAASSYHYGGGGGAPSVARASTPAPTTPTAMNVTPPKPQLPLSSFYKADNTLAWPADSPVEGDLKEKRSTFDQASQIVLDETKKNGVASLSSVTDARQKLIDYGKPALQYVRTHETPRLADTYHLFLLSLYESLAQAANPPSPAAPAPPAS